MPWKERSIMDEREEFVRLALADGANRRELCRRYGISPTTGYLWLRRYQEQGRVGLADHSRRPQHSPGQTPAVMEARVVAVRQAHPAWGGRKIRAVLCAEGLPAPSASTITSILARHHLIAPEATLLRLQPRRFEAAGPNDLWQMDFKGHLPLVGGGRCHPFTVLDDHSRFNLGLWALGSEGTQPVKARLIQLFQRYGLPNRILCDNGTPWGSSVSRFTAFGVWLLHLDVPLIHGRPYHPQTQGKEERFHRSLTDELLRTQLFATLDAAQTAFDAWRQVYNHVRPHEAIGLVPPSTRYQSSPRSYPRHLPAIEYPQAAVVRRVTTRGVIKLEGRSFYVGEAFAGYPLAIHPTDDAAMHTVYFRHYAVLRINLRDPVGA
jgi:transposase InsO family protein